MADFIKQHYVPQFYLKNFSINRNTICCLDKIELNTYHASISNIAQGKKFYETSNINLEHKLSQIEKEASKDINKLLANKKYKLLANPIYKARLAFYICIQLMRTPFVRNDFIDSIQSLKESIKHDDVFNKDLEDQFNFLLDEFEIKEAHLEFLSDVDIDIFRLVLTKKWIFLENKTKSNFWTSDNPVVFCNKKGNLGLSADYIHVFFPLSPKYSLCLIDPFNYSNFMVPKEDISKKYFDNGDIHERIENYLNIMKYNMKKPEKSKISDEKIIKNINSLQIKYCSRAVYSIENDFIDENNEIKNWITDYIGKCNSEPRTFTTEITTDLEGKMYFQKKN